MTGRQPWRTVGAGAALGVALALVGAGCGGDSPSPSTATSTSPAVTSSTTEPATTVAPTPSSTAGTSPTTSLTRPTVVDDVTGGSETERYTIKLTLPRLQGLADAAVQDAVNADIRAAVDVTVDEFLAGVTELADPPPDQPDLKSALVAGYKVSRVDQELASLRVSVSRYFAPAAHPGTVLLTFNHDLRTGRRLTLGDLFSPGAPYLAKLSELSRQLLSAQPDFDQLQEFVLPGTEPTAENFAGWTLTDQDLVITFAEYQVAPYALGMPHVSIPFASLRTMLDPNCPLAIHN